MQQPRAQQQQNQHQQQQQHQHQHQQQQQHQQQPYNHMAYVQPHSLSSSAAPNTMRPLSASTPVYNASRSSPPLAIAASFH
jgi:hypothetical protein